MTKPRPGEKVEEKEKGLQMMLSGEREIVNIMADTGLGATTIKNLWAMGRAKGLISKKDRLKGTGLKRVIKKKTAGETVKRLSGRPFVTQTIDPVPKDEHKSQETPKIVDNPEKSAEQESGQGISKDISEISTSLNSVKLELRNTIGEMNTRLTKVEQSSSNEDKVGNDQKKKESALVDMNYSNGQTSQTVVEESKEEDEGTRRVIEISPNCEIIFNLFRKKHPDAIETKDMTAFVNMCIEGFFFFYAKKDGA